MGSGGSDPYGIFAARKSLRGTYDTDKEIADRLGTIAGDRAATVAEGRAELARRREEDAAIAHVEATERERTFREFNEETARQIAAIRERKIDPTRVFASNGMKSLGIAASVVDGLYAGLHGKDRNAAVEQINHMIDQDIGIQEREIAREGSTIGARMNLLGEMRATYKDTQLAEAQARSLMYEAMKEQIAAEAARWDAPTAKAEADHAISALTREQSKLDIETALKKQADARAAAAAKAAADALKWKRDMEEREMRVKEGELIVKANAAKKTAADRADEKADEARKALGKELSDEKLVAAKKTIDDIKRKIVNPEGEVDGKKRIPGTGPNADTREKLFPGDRPPLAAGLLIPGYGGAHYLGKLDAEERIGRQDWARLADSYRVAVTGAGAGQEELARLMESFQGANTPAEQANAIRLADGMLAEREARIRASYDPEIVSEYDRRAAHERATRPKTVAREPVK